ncbi:hypothetical protein [uncultured Kiloniella sp.]|uniref:hypothetical protein n=1 Tax=uncultured Kiloniella sp. TaxID=1133091 RepID=UPI00263A3295|nr:hypothetical protein [uncultured Kiloniella sp.]
MIDLKNKLKALYTQKEQIEDEIKSLELQIQEATLNPKEQTKQEITTQEKPKQVKTTFSKDEKIDIFKSLFIARFTKMNKTVKNGLDTSIAKGKSASCFISSEFASEYELIHNSDKTYSMKSLKK